MKYLFFFFVGLYSIAPLIVVPIIAYSFVNWYLLIGIAVSYLGSFMAAKNFKPFYLLPLIAIGFWIKSGFDIHQYFTFFFFYALAGYILFKIADEYDNMRKTTPANKAEADLVARVDKQIEIAVQLYQQAHPNEPITLELFEKIKMKIFLSLPESEIKKLKT